MAAGTHDRLSVQVRAAAVADVELRRAAAFTSVIRAAASRTALGVNFVPGTANLNRVVEMSALCAALQAAYPELVGREGPPEGTMSREAGASALEQSGIERCRCTPTEVAHLLPWPAGRAAAHCQICHFLHPCCLGCQFSGTTAILQNSGHDFHSFFTIFCFQSRAVCL
jgi:hypothetical protein